MEIPAAAIRRLQSSLREAASAPSLAAAATATPPPFPTVPDAVAAFDSSASSSPGGPRCGRCGAAGGLLRGAESAVCAYCGTPRREEECGGIAFRGSAAYRWLLGSLGLDGSELVEFDDESADSSKTKEALKSGMVLSDLLDLKLTCPPENKETPVSSTSKEQSSAAYAQNLSGVNLDSFFIERRENTTDAAASTQTHAVVQKRQTTTSLEVHATSKDVYSSEMKISSVNQIEATPAFASWDANFQSAGSETVIKISKQLDLFKGVSTTESSSFPPAGSAINPVVATRNEANMKSTKLEDSKYLDLASDTLFKDESKTSPENTVAELTESTLSTNSVQSDQLPVRGDTGVSIDEAFDDWQEFTGGNQGSLSNAGEHMEGPVKSSPSEIDTWPVSSMEPSNNISDNSADDWQAFACSSGQGGDLMKSTEGSAGDQGGDLVKPVGEMASVSFEHSSEANHVDLWPVDTVNKEISNTKMPVEADDSFEDWQDFAASGQAQSTPFNQAGEMIEASHVTQKEANVDSWFTGNVSEVRSTDLVHTNSVMLDNFQGFAASDEAQHSPSNVGGKMMNLPIQQQEGTDSMQLWVDGSNTKATNTATTNIGSNSFDMWPDFTTSGHQQESLSYFGKGTTSVSSEPAKEIDPMELWLTSSPQESASSKGVNKIDDLSHGWQDFASFGPAQGSKKNPGEGHSVTDPSGAGPLDLWASNNANELKNHEPINEVTDPFDDWQDFRNSRPLDTSLRVSSNASLLDNPSALKPDTLRGLEFGSFAQSFPSQDQRDNKENSSEANTVPSDEHLERMIGIQQMGNVDLPSAIWPTASHGSSSISKPDPVNANVEKLLSQMHDLSFMLKDELSIPDKPVDHSES